MTIRIKKFYYFTSYFSTAAFILSSFRQHGNVNQYLFTIQCTICFARW